MAMTSITAHMVVKNEDQYVGYAIKSILPYVDRFLIVDTGSSDKTIEIIQNIKSKKIQFEKMTVKSASEMTQVRQSQIDQTDGGWLWVIDGDEIYTDACAQEVIEATQKHFKAIAVRRYDLLGDFYHRQIETVGSYSLYGHKGHLVTRLINLDKVKGLKYVGDYPNEAMIDANELSTKDIPVQDIYVTSHYLFHAMYLQRSSNGSNLPMINRSKYKIEKGISISEPIPEVMRGAHIRRRSVGYELMSAIITPIKQLKRKMS